MVWEKTDDIDLLAMANEENLSVEEIAGEMGREPADVQQRLDELTAPVNALSDIVVDDTSEKRTRIRKSWTKPEIERLTQLYDEGFSYAEIGRLMDRQSSAVAYKSKTLVEQGVLEPREAGSTPKISKPVASTDSLADRLRAAYAEFVEVRDKYYDRRDRIIRTFESEENLKAMSDEDKEALVAPILAMGVDKS